MENRNENYRKIRLEIDGQCQKLHEEHKAHTQCRKGCSACCMNFSVLPIEFHSILAEIKKQGVPKMNETDEGCLFLVNNGCTIYEFRPSICRSHGLPILNMDSEGENWELSYCPLNFENADEEYFTLENGFHQDLYNSKLYLANREFISNFQKISYKEDELVDLRNIKNHFE